MCRKRHSKPTLYKSVTRLRPALAGVTVALGQVTGSPAPFTKSRLVPASRTEKKRGKRKRVADMTPRERRGAKKVWRDYKRAKTAEKKAESNENKSTPGQSHVTVSRQKKCKRSINRNLKGKL